MKGMNRIQRLKSIVGEMVDVYVKGRDCIENVSLLAVGKNYIEIYDEDDNEKNLIIKLNEIQIVSFVDKEDKKDNTKDNEDDEDKDEEEDN